MTAALEGVPRVGLGCSPYRDGRHVNLDAAMKAAIDLGYRLLDTAEVYGTERQIGDLLRRPAAPPRSDFFLVSKVWHTNHGFDRVVAAAQGSLHRLGVEALDLYLVHAPESWRYQAELGDVSTLDVETLRRRALPRDRDGAAVLGEVPVAETWAAMLELQSCGLVAAIGVSNFRRNHLRELIHADLALPAVNQIACHPRTPQRQLVRFCQKRGILVMAHSPLSAPSLLHDPVLARVAKRHRKTPAQVALRWNQQRGVVPIPSSIQLCHLAENLDTFDFDLETDDLRAIDCIAESSSSASTRRPAEPF